MARFRTHIQSAWREWDETFIKVAGRDTDAIWVWLPGVHQRWWNDRLWGVIYNRAALEASAEVPDPRDAPRVLRWEENLRRITPNKPYRRLATVVLPFFHRPKGWDQWVTSERRTLKHDELERGLRFMLQAPTEDLTAWCREDWMFHWQPRGKMIWKGWRTTLGIHGRVGYMLARLRRLTSKPIFLHVEDVTARWALDSGFTPDRWLIDNAFVTRGDALGKYADQLHVPGMMRRGRINAVRTSVTGLDWPELMCSHMPTFGNHGCWRSGWKFKIPDWQPVDILVDSRLNSIHEGPSFRSRVNDDWERRTALAKQRKGR